MTWSEPLAFRIAALVPECVRRFDVGHYIVIHVYTAPGSESFQNGRAAICIADDIVMEVIVIAVQLDTPVSPLGTVFHDIVMDPHVPVIVFHIDVVMELLLTDIPEGIAVYLPVFIPFFSIQLHGFGACTAHIHGLRPGILQQVESENDLSGTVAAGMKQGRFRASQYVVLEDDVLHAPDTGNLERPAAVAVEDDAAHRRVVMLDAHIGSVALATPFLSRVPAGSGRFHDCFACVFRTERDAGAFRKQRAVICPILQHDFIAGAGPVQSGLQGTRALSRAGGARAV